MHILVILTIVFVITSSITVFDTRLIQAKRSGALPADEQMLPSWVGFIAWIHWGLALVILFIDWKYAIFLFIAKFILSVLPILETVGNILMRPFRP